MKTLLLPIAALGAILLINGAAPAQSLPPLEPLPPEPGELVISEVMFNPTGTGTDVQNVGEWFELTNISGKVLDVNNLYFQDGPFAGASGSDAYFQVLPAVATLPPMFPGQRFVFARSNDPALNGGIPQVDYAYASTSSTTPADHSQVGHAKMNMSNSNIDGMHITKGAPAFYGGTVIDSFSYNPASNPLPVCIGVSVERVDLYGPMSVVGVGNSPNVAPASIASTFGTTVPPQSGTPGAMNSMDATPVWHLYYEFADSNNQNTGAITVNTPLSAGAGTVTFNIQCGPSNGVYTLGYATGIGEVPLSLLVGGMPGSILLDLYIANYLFDWNDIAYYLDPAGNGSLTVAYNPDPTLNGSVFYFQYLGVDFATSGLTASKAIRMYMNP